MRGHSSSLSLAGAVLVSFAAAQFAPGAEGEERPTLRELLDKLPFGLHGFVETRVGTRVQSDRYISETASMGEARLQLEASKTFEIGDYRPELRVKADLYYDAIEKKAIADLREANVVFSPFEFLDLKLGRQTLTWGTGDLLFINDLFPKDWESFLIGRDDEYLKAPSDAVKLSFFTDAVNVDVAYTPRFRSDNYVDGERLSYWSDALGRRAGQDFVVRDDEPSRWFRDDELALRLYKNVGGYEVAFYGYHGFWRTPGGMNPLNGKATFPRLAVCGASVRGPVGKGIGNVEVGCYHSLDDRGGADPLIRNSEFRFLVGYEQEVGRNFTAGVQYYVECLMDYDAYRRTLPPGIRARDQVRHLVTLRLTKLLMNQNLRLSLFVFCSPSDADAYVRPKVHYKVDDHWSVEAGANLFRGARDHTFFGQFEENSNIYGGVRYSF
ncbi:MAG TPA: hypothetical protein VNE39_08505 [Planctomycetota bacterium]|nr:hypothetical protein [Planctomycetota bacterium]